LLGVCDRTTIAAAGHGVTDPEFEIVQGESWKLSISTNLTTLNGLCRMSNVSATLRFDDDGSEHDVPVEGLNQDTWGADTEVSIVTVGGVPVVSGREDVKLRLKFQIPDLQAAIGRTGKLVTRALLTYPYYDIDQAMVGSFTGSISYENKTYDYESTSRVRIVETRSGDSDGGLDTLFVLILIVAVVLAFKNAKHLPDAEVSADGEEAEGKSAGEAPPATASGPAAAPGPDIEVRRRELVAMLQAAYGANDWGRAEEHCRELLRVEEAALGADNPETLRTLSSLAELLQNQGRYDEAERAWKEGRDRRRRSLGSMDGNTIQAELRLAQLYEAANRPADALHQYTLVSLNAAMVFGPEDERSRAVQQRFQQLGQEVMGSDRYWRCADLVRAADQARAAGEEAVAEANLRQAVELHTEVLGAEHAMTVDLRARSPRAGREVLQLQERVFGGDHPNTQATAHTIARGLVAGGGELDAARRGESALTLAAAGSQMEQAGQHERAQRLYAAVGYNAGVERTGRAIKEARGGTGPTSVRVDPDGEVSNFIDGEWVPNRA
jgi:tetratricopeptide (TPR) repeat protein